MIPQSILGRLDRVRRRELGVRLAWGLSRGLAVAAAALVVFCFIDWTVDRWYETPPLLRGLMVMAHVLLWVGAAAFWLVIPVMRRRNDREVALWAEAHFPELGHRLISAVELNGEGANIRGMSPELIAAVTIQADEAARRTDFAERVDRTRLKKGAGFVAGAAAVAALFLMAGPETTKALLARQFLADRDIPRSVKLAAEKPEIIHPTGEEIRLRFRVSGLAAPETGEVRIDPVDRPSETYELKPEGDAYVAHIPSGSSHFEYRAWIGDGRTRTPSRVTYEPRPVVQKLEAWLLLPEYCGKRPDGSPYEQARTRGEIAGPSGSSARVIVEIQKPIVKGFLELLGRTGGETAPESVFRSVGLEIGKDARTAVARFDLRPGETSYRISVADKNEFWNTAPPRRGIAILPDEPPRVVMLPERFLMPGESSISDDTEVEGMPIPVGSAIRIAYYCAHPYGLDRARLAWRVLKGARIAEEGPAAMADEPWNYLPLGEVRATPEVGAFDLRFGHFEKSDRVEFYPLPSPDPDRLIGRTEGGGCLAFQTAPLAGVNVGDQIEFAIEVFARNPALAKTPGRSETRSKVFVTSAQLIEWIKQTLKHESRIRQLEARQRNVFTPEGTDR